MHVSHSGLISDGVRVCAGGSVLFSAATSAAGLSCFRSLDLRLSSTR
ncbi:MAG TPA: hypothetical protein VM821_03345 [Abditibacteriaceae bacterium]|nr:hypothetical protein [Abditibacteriaceae bacterium]